MLNKTDIEARLIELKKKLEQEQIKFNQAQANGNALIGAIQECELWLTMLNDSEV